MRRRVRSQVYILLSVARAADPNSEIASLDREKVSTSTQNLANLRENLESTHQIHRAESISMQRMRSCQTAVYLLAAFVVLQTTMVHCEPNPEPTRRVEVSNWDDLRKYLDHFTDLYTLNGKARYGKRGEIPSGVSPIGRNWNTMKILDDTQDTQQQQQHQQPRFDQRRLASRQFLREVESSEDGKHASRPNPILDIVEKYYDGVQ